MTEKSDQETKNISEKLTPLQLKQLVHFPHYLEQISPLIMYMYKFGAYTFSFRDLFETKHRF